ncbi:MAG: PIN domain-containing protein [Actinomycetota bacterium]|nr:PIN domain-containing protein [Actinomycetota bacterium]
MALSAEPEGPWLIDKSALVRLSRSVDALAWSQRIQRGLVRVATVTLLEAGFSARSGAEIRSGADRALLEAMPVEYLTPRAEDRAVQIQAMLAERGQHRAAAIPDLLIAALAELAGLCVLHHDHDFELIAVLTGQPIETLRWQP